MLPQFWFGFFNYFSGQTLYDSFIYQLFNIFFTSFPIIIYAIVDQEFNPEVLMANNLNFYKEGMEKECFNGKRFWMSFFFGSWQSLILVLFSFMSIEGNFINDQGFSQEFWEAGTMIFGQCVLISNLKILGFSNTFNFLSTIVMFFTCVSYFFSLLIANFVLETELYGRIFSIFKTPYFHFGNFLIVFSTCFFDYGYEMFKSNFLLKNIFFFIFIV